MAFTTLIQTIGGAGEDESVRLPRAVAEIFPYAVLSTIDKSYPVGWGRRIRPIGVGARVEAGPEPTRFFTADDIPAPPPGSILARSVSNFREIAKILVFFRLAVPANTKIEIRYPEPPTAQSTLILSAEGTYEMAFEYRGGWWMVGLPQDHPHAYRVHPTVIQTDDPNAHTLGNVNLDFEMRFGEFGPRTYGDYYAWASRIFDAVEWNLSWIKYLERLPSPHLLGISRNIEEILRRLDEPGRENGNSIA